MTEKDRIMHPKKKPTPKPFPNSYRLQVFITADDRAALRKRAKAEQSLSDAAREILRRSLRASK